MNSWTKKSINLANQRDYLDQLYKVYPMSTNRRRELDDNSANLIRGCIDEKNNDKLIYNLINLVKKDKLSFPIKDSYVSFLKRDMDAINRNPRTVNRLAGMIYEMGFDKVINSMSKPIETNRQIGPLFKEWIKKGSLGFESTTDKEYFLNTNKDLIFIGNDKVMMDLAKENFGYIRNKGIDFMGRINGKYVLGEAKFLTDFGGHQNDQMLDAFETMRHSGIKRDDVICISILDGVLYLNSSRKGKMYKNLEAAKDNEVILSSLFLRDFLYTL